jgi:hypothetical protein
VNRFLFNLQFSLRSSLSYDFSRFNQLTPGNQITDFAFLEWFIGFVEGNGSFSVFETESKKPRLSLVINQADYQRLKFIRERFGFGNVFSYNQKDAQGLGSSQYTRFVVYDRAAIFALISLFNGHLHLQKVQKRFKRWVGTYNQLNSIAIEVKGLQTLESINFGNAWLSGFMEAEGGFSASISENTKYAANYRLRLKAFVDQKNEFPVLQRIALLLLVKTVTVRNKVNSYFEVECTSKNQFTPLLKYLEAYPFYGKKRLVYNIWCQLVKLYLMKDHLKSSNFQLVKELALKVHKQNNVFKEQKSVLKRIDESEESLNVLVYKEMISE